MADLPEVELLRHSLDREINGKKVKAAEAESMSALSEYSARKYFTNLLEGVKIGAVTRIGKLITIALDNDTTWCIDVGTSGQLRRATNKAEVEPGTEVTITFTQGGQLRLVDPDGTADMFVVGEDDDLLDLRPGLLEIGMDPLQEPISWTHFAQLLRSRADKLKTLLTDDTFVVGLGDIYSDEILFNSGLRYDRVSDTLSTQEVRRLYRSLVETLHDAIKYRGTTLESTGWRDLFGEPGDYQDHLDVYEREGELSPRSRAPIVKAKFAGRWTYYCETQV